MPPPFLPRLLGALALCLGSVSLRAQQPGSLLQVISPPAGGPQEAAAMGLSTAVNASYTIAGAPFDDAGAQDSGVVKVFDTATGDLLHVIRNPTPATSDQFGMAVALSGSRLVVGAFQDDTAATNAGIAYVYDLAGPAPTVPAQTLQNPTPAASDQFGFSVSISGSQVAVSANLDDAGATNAGAVHLFDLSSPTPGVPVLSLTNPNPVNGDAFGQSVSIHNRYLVVGVPQKDSGGMSNVGAVVLYDLNAPSPSAPLATFINPHPADTDTFGSSVSLSGTRFVVGVPMDDATGTNSGRAYIYDFTSGLPSSHAIVIENPGPATSDQFGYAVAMHGDQVVVGAPFDDTGAGNSGRAYVFNLASSQPQTHQVMLAKTSPGSADNLALCVAVHGSWVAAGVPFDDGAASNTGSIALFNLAGPSPDTPVRLIQHPSPASGDLFGGSVCMSGSRFIAGASLDDNGALNAGSAYVYDLASGSPGVPILALPNPNPQNGDEFGRAVAISGGWVAVSAPFAEAGGFNDGGRVYIFNLASPTPSAPALVILNPEPASSDQFGNSLALSDGKLVVGTRLDDALALNSGSAYVYDLAGPSPSVPLLTLRNPSPASQDFFGHAVAIHQNRVLVSASSDDTGATDTGIVYLFDLASPTPASPVLTLANPTPDAGDQFGVSLCFSGSLAAVGANLDDSGASDSGVAYVFDLAGSSPSSPAWTLNNPQPAANDQFGFSLAIDGTRVTVGSHLDDLSADGAGSAWVYELSSPTPTTPELVLLSSQPGVNDQFGYAVAAASGRVLVGASRSDLVTPDKGAAFVFGAQLTQDPVDIGVDHPPGSPLINGVASASFGSTLVGGAPLDRSFQLRSLGSQALTGLAATLTGSHAGDFAILQLPPSSLDAGDSFNFVVRFSPSAGGTRSAVLRIASDDPDENPFLVNLTGNGLLPTPDISIEQPGGTSLSSGAAQINFGSIPILENSSDRSFTLRNTGTADLTGIQVSLSGTNPGAYLVLVPPASTVSPGQSTSFTLRFAPQISGELTAVVRVASNDPDESPFDVFLYGIGVVTPHLSLEQPAGSPLTNGLSSIAFGTTQVGAQPVDRTFTVRNTGTGPLTGISLALSGPAPGDFQIAVPLPPSVPAGTESVFVVRFLPTAGGQRLATLSLASNDPDNNPFVVQLSGASTVAPNLSIELPVGNPLFPSQSLAEFGNVELAGQPADITFTLRNIGTSDLTGILPSFTGEHPGDFSVLSPPASTLSPNQSTTLTVRFQPLAQGERFGILRVASNDPDDNPFEVEMSGFATPVPDITVESPPGSPLVSGGAGINFGDVNAGLNPVERSLVLRSTGSGALSGISLELQGAAAEDFAIASFPQNNLPPGEQSAFVLRFTPVPDKVSTARLVIHSNDPNESPFEIPLSGTGIAVPDIRLDQPAGNLLVSAVSSVGFDTVAVGDTPREQVFTLRNEGPAELKNIAVQFQGDHPADFSLPIPPPATLAPEASATFTVRFAPVAGGQRSAILSLASNDPDENPFTLSLTGFATVKPDLAIEYPASTPLIHSLSSVDFGSLLLNSGGRQLQLTLRNVGTGTLNNLAVSFLGGQTSDFVLSAQPPSILNPGQSAVITITFTPGSSGLRQTTLRVASNDPNDNPFSIGLVGTGLVIPDIALEQPAGSSLVIGSASVNFGETIPGGPPASRVFTLRNEGNGTLSGLAAQLSGANAADFTLTTSPPASLAPGQSATFALAFAPSSTGPRSASFSLASNDPDENPFIVSLSGSGALVPDIAVEEPAGTNRTSGFSLVTFGSALVRDGFQERSFTLRNTGTAPLSGLAFALSGSGAADFTVTVPPPASLEAGASATCVIRFAPASGGDRAALLSIASNDPDENPFFLSLTGFGITIPDQILEHPLSQPLTSGASSLEFGTIVLGATPANRVVTIRNPGTGPLLISGATLSGSAAADFSLPQPPPSSVAAGATATFTVRFTPRLNGARSATLVLASNDPDTPSFALGLNGTGLAQPDIALEHPAGQPLLHGQAAIDCGSVVLGAVAAQRSVTLRNTGTAQLGNLSVTITGAHPDDFSVTSFRNTPLAAAESSDFTVRFNPGGPGPRSATLVIASNDPDENPFQIQLTGIGVALPSLQVEYPATQPLTSGSASLVFGSVFVGAQPGEYSLTLRNTGTAPLENFVLSFTGRDPYDFSVSGPSVASLQPGASTPVLVRFTPLTLGPREAVLNITSNAPGPNPFTIRVSGSARDYFTEIFTPSRPNDSAGALYTFRPGSLLPPQGPSGPPPVETPPSPLQGLDVPDAFASGELLDSREFPDPQDDDRVIVERLVRSGMKHPLLLVRDHFQVSGSKRRRVSQSAVVADHILVRPKSGTQPATLLSSLSLPGAQIRAQLPASGLWLVSFPSPTLDSVSQAVAAAVSGGHADLAEPDAVVRAAAIPNDPSFPGQWSLNNTGQSGGTAGIDVAATSAWDSSTGSAAVRVGVLDTGIDASHPDLAGNLWTHPGEIPANGLDDDGNGYIDDVRGWNFVANTPNAADDHSHGTHVAGTLGAVGGNSLGVAGVAWQVSLLPLKILDASGAGLVSDAAEALAYARQLGVHLTCNAWGGGGFSQALRQAVIDAGTSGQLFVAAAGNDSRGIDSQPFYPAGYDAENVISVTSINASGQLSWFANQGASTVHLAAPGSAILSTLPGGAYGLRDGTSAAAAHVAGACVLLKSAHPSWTSSQIKAAILGSVSPLPALAQRTITGGSLNAAAALQASSGLLVSPSQGFTASGPAGSTLTPSSREYLLRNLSSSPMAFTVSTDQPWVGLSTSSGSLPAGGSQSVLVSLLPAASSLPAGSHHARVTFTQSSSGASFTRTLTLLSADRYHVTRDPVLDFPSDPSGSASLSLSDDSFVEIPLANGASIPFQGVHYSSVFVGSNGYITFGSGDWRPGSDAEHHFSLPRLAALSADLDPSAGGSVLWKQTENHLAITFDQVRAFGSPAPNSFQFQLFFDGRLTVTVLDAGTSQGVLGISNGLGRPEDFSSSDFSSYPGSNQALAVFTSNPASQTVQSGASVEFHGQVVGAPPIAFQWHFNGLPIPGATSSTLQIPSASSASSGVYRLAAINAFGQSFSQPATLAVEKLPATIQLQNLSHTFDGAQFPVSAQTTPPGLSVTLTYNGSPSAPAQAGSYTVLAEIDDPVYQGSASATLVIAKAPQIIDFPSPADQPVTGSLTLSAVGGPAGLPVTFALVSGPAVLSGGDTLSFTGLGPVTVTASQLGNINFADAAPVTRTFNVVKAPASVLLSGLAQTFSGSPLSATAQTNPPGLPVSLLYDGQPGLPVNAGTYSVSASIDHPTYQGSASASLVIARAPQSLAFPPIPDQLATASLSLSASAGPSGSPVTFAVTSGPASLSGPSTLVFSATGTVSVTASQAGNANYLDATPVSRSFNVTKAPAQIDLAGLSQTFNGSPRSVTASTTPPGLAVTFAYAGSGSPPVNAGSYTVTAAIQDPRYQGSASATLVVARAPQSISFPAIGDQVATASVPLSASGGPSGRPVTFTIASGPGSIVSGNNLAFTGAGAVTIIASQSGNSNYLDATPVSQTFQVTKAAASVLLGDLAQTFDGSPRSASASTSPSGLSVAFTYDGSSSPPVNAGSYAVTASIEDPRYQGSASATLVVAKAPQSLNFPPIPDQFTNSPLNLFATGGASGNPVTFTLNSGPASLSAPSTLSFSGPGSVSVTASQDGGPNHLPADPVSRSFSVLQANASVTLSGLSQTYSGSPLSVSATTFPAGLPVLITYDGSTSPPVNVGTYSVSAVINDGIHTGGASAQFTITRAPQSILFSTPPDQSTTDILSLSASGGPSGNPVSFSIISGPATLSGNLVSFSSSGSVTIAASQSGNANYLDAPAVTRTFNVNKVSITPGITNLLQAYDGTPRAVSISPAGLPVDITYDGSLNPPVNPGSYSVSVSVNDPRFEGFNFATLVVTKGSASIAFADLAQTYSSGPRPVSVLTSPPGLAVSLLYDGGTAPPVAAGSYAVTAVVNDPLYQGSASATLVVSQAAQSIDFPPIPDQPSSATLALSAIGGSSSQPVTFSVVSGPATLSPGNLLSFSDLGAVTVSASQDGDANHLPAAPVLRSFQVLPSAATISLSRLFQAPDGSPKPVSVTTTPPGLNVRVTYDGSTTPPSALGSYAVVATIDDPRHSGSASGTLVLDHRADRSLKEPDQPNGEAPGSDVPWDTSLAGRYDGLLRDSSDGFTPLGAIENFVITPPRGALPRGGSFSGRLRLNGRSLTLRGFFDSAGAASLSLSPPGFTPIQIALQLQRTAAGHELVAGSLQMDRVTAFVRLPRAPFHARLNPAPASWTGRFTLVLPSSPGSGLAEPGGDGWASVSVSSAGLVKVIGKLADGSPLVDSSPLSAAGDFALFTDLYRSQPLRGRFAGRLLFENVPGVSDFHGLTQWLKRPDSREARYPSGFDLQIEALGSRYSAPSPGSRILAELADANPNASLSLLGPSLPPDRGQEIERVISWQASNTLRHYGPETLTGTANRVTGLVSGRYRDPASGLLIPFQGVAFQKQGIAAGHFLLGAGSGALRIQPGTHFPYPGSENAGPAFDTLAPSDPAPNPGLTQIPFNPAAAGSYLGHFGDASRLSGALENLILSSSGAFSGSLWLGGLRHPVSGVLDANGSATLSLTLPGFPDPVSFSLNLHQLEGSLASFELCGTLSLPGSDLPFSLRPLPVHSATLRSPFEGAFTLAMLAPPGADPAAEPAGDACATLRVSHLGLCTGALALPDGTKTTLSGHVSADGRWTLHRALYGNPARGWITGTLAFRQLPGISDLDGAWTWQKLPGATPASTRYPAGFATTRSVVGSRHTAPPPGASLWPALAPAYYNAWWRLHGPGPLDRAISWTSANRVLYFGPDQLSINVNPATGLVSGSYRDPATSSSFTFNGVFLSSQQLVSGHWLSPSNAGRFTIEPR